MVACVEENMCNIYSPWLHVSTKMCYIYRPWFLVVKIGTTFVPECSTTSYKQLLWHANSLWSVY